MVDQSPLGSRETRDFIDNAFEEVPVTIGCSEISEVIVTDGEIQDEGDGSNGGA